MEPLKGQRSRPDKELKVLDGSEETAGVSIAS
jgi:hypothetical protein